MLWQQRRKAHVAEAREARRAEHRALKHTVSGRERGEYPTPWHRAIALIDFTAAGSHRKVLVCRSTRSKPSTTNRSEKPIVTEHDACSLSGS
jgi:hypothetical protein